MFCVSVLCVAFSLTPTGVTVKLGLVIQVAWRDLATRLQLAKMRYTHSVCQLSTRQKGAPPVGASISSRFKKQLPCSPAAFWQDSRLVNWQRLPPKSTTQYRAASPLTATRRNNNNSGNSRVRLNRVCERAFIE